MDGQDAARATAAARGIATEFGLDVDDAILLQNSNKLTVRLGPDDVVARIGGSGTGVAAFEVAIARELAACGSPVAALDPRVEPRVHERDGFDVTFWTYCEPVAHPEISPGGHAIALMRLHEGMRRIDVATPHFLDRVGEAQRLVSRSDLTPALTDQDRELLSTTLRTLRRTIGSRSRNEQVLHGEPHAGNVVSTPGGPVFIDLETCCRGPVEFDLAHVPEEVAAAYGAADPELLDHCRQLVLAMVAAWRHDAGDQFPNGVRAGRAILDRLRDGPPWPVLGELRDSPR
ncbi:aminoglycoside phosphotransferase family protein [Desertimonas flava]|uniref:phosphotransferase n=1 Tax=Desertimonas flava TaxID=2064846 RepID=UPI000E35068B|nr:aminoglycoside phosphotransferase family protein [Desertimonas flava]